MENASQNHFLFFPLGSAGIWFPGTMSGQLWEEQQVSTALSKLRSLEKLSRKDKQASRAGAKGRRIVERCPSLLRSSQRFPLLQFPVCERMHVGFYQGLSQEWSHA